MTRESINRKLAAVFYADIAGYSRLTRRDETGTHQQVMSTLDFASEAITNGGGTVLRYAGDAILAEFLSVVAAIEVAVSIQQELSTRNSDKADDDKVQIRIGINLGEVIQDRGEIFGDGVNLAARLEATAQPGGVCISSFVHDQICGKIGVEFADGGEESFKNIDTPVRIFHWHPGKNVKATPRSGATHPVSDKPSIAVLPFANMSNDPEQEYFADGIAEDIITALSHIKQWLVIARNSSFAYKGRHVDIREIAKDLGVRYVLEGSVRKGGNKLRITGQLIEAETGTHLWAAKFDGELEDVFELQDKITESVVGAIEPSLRKAEIDRSKRKLPADIGAYDLFLQALPLLYVLRPEQNEKALALLHKAIEIDPDYAPALAYLAWGYEERISRAWGAFGSDDKGSAIAYARRAIATDRDDPSVLSLAGFVLVKIARDYDQGLQATNRAREINPNIASVSAWVGFTLSLSGNPEEGLTCIEDAIRVSPGDPGAFTFLTGAALAHLLCGRPAEAVDLAVKSARMYSDWEVTYLTLAAALVQLDRVEEARVAVTKILELSPNITVSSLRKNWPIRDKEKLNMILDALIIAGLP